MLSEKWTGLLWRNMRRTLRDQATRPILQDPASHRRFQAENWNKGVPPLATFSQQLANYHFCMQKSPGTINHSFQQESSANRKEAKTKAWETSGVNQQAWGQFKIWQSSVLNPNKDPLGRTQILCSGLMSHFGFFFFFLVGCVVTFIESKLFNFWGQWNLSQPPTVCLGIVLAGNVCIKSSL